MLITSMTETMYRAALTHLSMHIFRHGQFPTMDFEQTAQRSFGRVFPTMQFQKWDFHFSQSLLRWIPDEFYYLVETFVKKLKKWLRWRTTGNADASPGFSSEGPPGHLTAITSPCRGSGRQFSGKFSALFSIIFFKLYCNGQFAHYRRTSTVNLDPLRPWFNLRQKVFYRKESRCIWGRKLRFLTADQFNKSLERIPLQPFAWNHVLCCIT